MPRFRGRGRGGRGPRSNNRASQGGSGQNTNGTFQGGPVKFAPNGKNGGNGGGNHRNRDRNGGHHQNNNNAPQQSGRGRGRSRQKHRPGRGQHSNTQQGGHKAHQRNPNDKKEWILQPAQNAPQTPQTIQPFVRAQQGVASGFYATRHEQARAATGLHFKHRAIRAYHTSRRHGLPLVHSLAYEIIRVFFGLGDALPISALRARTLLETPDKALVAISIPFQLAPEFKLLQHLAMRIFIDEDDDVHAMITIADNGPTLLMEHYYPPQRIATEWIQMEQPYHNISLCIADFPNKVQPDGSSNSGCPTCGTQAGQKHPAQQNVDQNNGDYESTTDEYGSEWDYVD